MVTDMIEVKLQSTLDKVEDVAIRLAQEGADFNVWLLKGEMGSGKTTLVRNLLQVLSSNDHATSPTYSLINKYMIDSGRSVYHMDLYRLKNIEEVLELGITEFLDSGDLCIVEWPELIQDLVERPYLEIIINRLDNEDREYQIKKHE